MRWLAEYWASSQEFVELGGTVVLAIVLCLFLMWAFIVERYLYIRTGHRALASGTIDEWHARADRSSWYAHQIRRAMVSRVSVALTRPLPIIKTFVSLCPLLGLFGTVTGMIKVFDVLAFSGSNNPRAMAAGVSEATLTTLAGLVAAVSGLPASVQLERRMKTEIQRLEDELAPED